MNQTRITFVQETKRNNSDVLAWIRNNIILFAVFLYFIGWVFVNSYFNAFGVQNYALDIPFHFFLVYSCYALTHAGKFACPISTIFVLIFAVFLLIISIDTWFVKTWTKSIKKFLATGMLIGLLISSYFMAKFSGEDSAKARMKNPKPPATITIVFKNKDMLQYMPTDFQIANENQALQLFTQTKDRVYVFRFVQDSIKDSIYVYDIAKDDICVSVISDTTRK